MAAPVLKAQHLGIQFGGLKAVDDFNMEIGESELVGLIGPNGAGKTTVFNLITGVYKPTEGSFYLCGERMNGKKTHQIVHAGIARTFQNIRLFKKMTVIENVKTAMQGHTTYGMADAIFRTKKYWQQEAEITARAKELLSVVHLSGKEDLEADNLPYGEQRRLEIARALATDMKLLLLDEPTSGLDPVVRDEVLDLLYDFMQDENHAILLSSHITSDLDKIADEITFIHKGEVLLSEPRDELLDTCGILRCTADQLNALDPSAVRAKRVGTFGCEALVRRDGVPENWSVEPVNIEQIMLFLTRGEDAR